jgi:hypothetical protein
MDEWRGAAGGGRRSEFCKKNDLTVFLDFFIFFAAAAFFQ